MTPDDALALALEHIITGLQVGVVLSVLLALFLLASGDH